MTNLQGSTQSPLARRTLLLCTIAYAALYIARYNLSVASPLLEQAGHMSKAGIGLMGSVFFAVYAVGRFLNGYIGDVLPSKLLLIGGLLIVGAANMVIGLLPPVTVLICLWGVNGLAQSMLWGPVLRLVSTAYQGSSFRQTAIVILTCSTGLGSILAILLSRSLAGAGLWAVFVGPGLLALLICLPLAFLPKAGEQPSKPNWAKTLQLFKNKDILCRLFPAAAHGAIKDNLILWAPLLFMEWYGIDLGSAAAFTFLMPVAMLLGRIAYPFLERRCKGERRVSLWAFAFCIVTLAPFVCVRLPAPIAAILLALTVLWVSVINVAFMAIHPLSYEASGQLSMAAGLLDSITYAGSALGTAAFGYLIGQYGYLPMFGICIAILLISIGSMLLVPSKKDARLG